MKKTFLMTGVIFLTGLVIGAYTTVTAADPGLVQILTNKLGVTEKQATGGAGCIFNTAQQKMSKNDFTSLAKAVPGIDSMMAAAPKKEEKKGALRSAASLLGKGNSSLSIAASLAESFSQLGMSSGMVNAFIPIILDYVQEKGGEAVMNALQAALK